MSYNYNRVILMGRLTAPPEMRATAEGTEYCNFTVAVDRDFVKKGEERQADFISCTAWRATAVFINKYFGKGSMIHIEGKWQHDKYVKDGETRYSDKCAVDNVSFCGSKNESGAEPKTMGVNPDDGDFKEINEDDLPF